MAAADTYPETLPRTRRRELGAYYTPDWIVDVVVAESLAGPLARARWLGDGAPELRILDPACGDGRFLRACVERLVQRPGAERRAIVHRCVVGIERDAAAAERARIALGPGADIRVAEALTSGAAEHGVWDVVIGNPPWLRSAVLKRTDPALWQRLRGSYAATSYKEWDLYAPFIEQALAWAAPSGEIGLVTPSRWLTAAFAGPLRARVAPSLRRVVDLGARQVFTGATTYTALVFLRRAPVDEVEVVRADLERRVPTRQLGSAPWSLGESAELARLRRVGPPLGSLARIAKGAGSNADPVFLLERRGTELWSVALARPVAIEPDWLVPCLRGRDIGAYSAHVQRVALFPYQGRRLVPFSALGPGAADYLAACRPLLEARERGRFRGDRFYAWGRPQNLEWLRAAAPKVVVPDATLEGRAALDCGTLVIDTAYAVRPTGTVSIGLLLAVLNHAVVGIWLRALGIPLRGGYFRMKTDYLRGLPVPDPDRPEAQRAAACALAGATEEARQLLDALYGL